MYIQYLKLPPIPESILKNLPQDLTRYENKAEYGNYRWTDSFNKEVDEWCKENICADMYWGFQIMTGDVPKHMDVGTKTKLSFLVDPGGKNIRTCFWDEHEILLLNEYIIPPRQWHILKADTKHSVEGVTGTRFSVTGRIF